MSVLPVEVVVWDVIL